MNIYQGLKFSTEWPRIILLSLFAVMLTSCKSAKVISDLEVKKYNEKRPIEVHQVENNQMRTERLTKPLRLKLLQSQRVIDVLQIEPNMTILDVGAGTGFFTFQFSQSLNGTGKVFATDKEYDMVQYIKTEMKKLKLHNITPIQVSSKGLDPFYKEHSYDIIFLSGIYHHLWRHENYFRDLRPSLKKEGRLFILHPKMDPDFSEALFSDFKELIEILNGEGEHFPIFQRLGNQSQEFIKNWQEDQEVPIEIRTAIIQDFNKMLLDRRLFFDFLDFYYMTKDSEPWNYLKKHRAFAGYFQLIQWLFLRLDENGVFDEREKELTDIDKNRLYKLNRVFLNGSLQPYRWRWVDGSLIIVGKDNIRSTLENVGYHLVREYDFLETFYFLEFKKQ